MQHVWSPQGSPDGQPRTKQFQIHAASLPRFYMTWFQSGLQNMQLQIEGARELLTNGQYMGPPKVQCQRARYTFWYANGTQVSLDSVLFVSIAVTANTRGQSIWTGNLTVIFVPFSGNEDLKFHTLEFEIHKTEEYIAKSQIERVLTQASPNMNKSPKMSHTPGKNKALKNQQESLSVSDFPCAPVNEFGVTSAVMQFFEVMKGTNRYLENQGD